MILSKWGASVAEAENGKEAIEKLKEAHFDLLLLDVRMPVLDGYETAIYIRQQINRSADELPIFAITAISQEEEKRKFEGLQINDFLVKPVSEQNLARVLIQSDHIAAIPPPTNGAGESTQDTKLLDLSGLRQMAGKNEDFILSMLDELTEMSEKEFGNLKSAIDKEDYERIADIAHKMASPYRHTSKAVIHKTLKDIENEAEKQNNISRIHHHFQYIKESYAQLKSEIDAYKSSTNKRN